MKTGLVTLVVVFLGSYFLGLFLELDNKQDFLVYKSTCNLLDGSCHISNEGVEYMISLQDTPSPLKPFGIQLTPLKSQPSNVDVEFQMQGMNMGNNFYSLQNSAESWMANVLLPVCSLGRNDWLLRVAFSYEEKVHTTEFRFTQ